MDQIDIPPEPGTATVGICVWRWSGNLNIVDMNQGCNSWYADTGPIVRRARALNLAKDVMFHIFSTLHPRIKDEIRRPRQWFAVLEFSNTPTCCTTTSERVWAEKSLLNSIFNWHCMPNVSSFKRFSHYDNEVWNIASPGRRLHLAIKYRRI